MKKIIEKICKALFHFDWGGARITESLPEGSESRTAVVGAPHADDDATTVGR